MKWVSLQVKIISLNKKINDYEPPLSDCAYLKRSLNMDLQDTDTVKEMIKGIFWCIL